MKTFFILLSICLLSQIGYSQTADSTTIKLNTYKKMYDEKLIDSTEYVKLKSELLFGPKKVEKQIDYDKLLKEGNSSIAAGSVLIAIGTTGIFVSLITNPRGYGLLVATGSVMDLAGIIILANGSPKRQIAKSNLAIRVGPNHASLCYTF